MVNEPVVVETDLKDLFDYSLQLNRWFLKPIGAWPVSSTTTTLERIVSFILVVICYCFILTTIVPCILFLFFEAESTRLKLKVLGPLVHWFVGGFNYTALLYHNDKIGWCVERVRSDWQSVNRSKDQQIMLKDARFGRYVAGLCAIFMQVGVLTYCFITGFTMQIVQIGNETRTKHLYPCPAYRWWITLDTWTSPTNEIVLASQVVSGFIINSSAVGAFSLAAVFAAHAHGQLNVLMMVITELVNRSKEDAGSSYFFEIGIVVEHHLRILSFISRIEDVMNEICFMELFNCTLNMCMLVYYVLTEWDDRDYRTLTTYGVILCSMTFNIFIVCYIGETLTEQCKKVGEITYMTNWYNLSDKNILDLILIISRSNTEIRMTAGKFIQMSFETFKGVIKTAFAYLNVLRQTT